MFTLCHRTAWLRLAAARSTKRDYFQKGRLLCRNNDHDGFHDINEALLATSIKLMQPAAAPKFLNGPATIDEQMRFHCALDLGDVEELIAIQAAVDARAEAMDDDDDDDDDDDAEAAGELEDEGANKAELGRRGKAKKAEEMLSAAAMRCIGGEEALRELQRELQRLRDE
eukprot:NODE_4850_length_752_cov_29.204836_g4497_i0.p1 GENE.NODE_4850_length_752_cov_29.204836_g4497_i0~~NODE_4850_length_752_cov_29.204836_g4497_i0.p1  ORF type:complete len:170 (+),score=39.75 NODE_4850_length_752_cov_29.204836_g4497_i0:86-595(+)